MIGFSPLAIGALVTALVLLVVSVSVSPPALRAARSGPSPNRGFWLSLASTAASALIAVVVCLVAVLRPGRTCISGPPGTRETLICRLCGLPTLASVVGVLLLVVSLFLWPPWRRPLKLQLVRVLHLAVWWSATLSIYLVCGD